MKSGTHFMRRMIGGFVIFAIVLAGSLLVQSQFPFSIWGRTALLLPVFPAIYVGYMLARGISELDEMQQRIQLEALAFSLANTALLTFVLGLMQISGGMDINLTWVLPIASAFWGIGLLIATRRYR